MPEYNRRTLVRGAAWSIPVVALAAQAPAFAGSTNAPRPTGVTVCKEAAGSKCYRFFLTFARPSQDWTIELASVVLVNTTTPSTGTDVFPETNPKEFTVSSAAGAANVFRVQACTTGNLANAVKVTFVYTATPTTGPSQTVTVTYDYESTPPCTAP